MATNFFKRYIWLIDLINRRGYIHLREISEAWSRSPLNETGNPLSERTFFNHKAAIEDMFGIEIRNDRSLGFYIRSNDFSNDNTLCWMLNTLCMNNLLQENADMKDRILVNAVPSSQKFLEEVISAMRSGRIVSLCYQSFKRPQPSTFTLEPYCVKLFKQRWYVLGNSSLGLRVYALDRFVDMEELDETYVIPEDFDAETYFNDYFGIIIGEKAVNVKIKAMPNKVKYLRTLPLHGSQQESPQEDGSSIFSYHIAPTYDFIQELLSHGNELEVLEPKELRDEIAGIISTMNSIYDND